MRPHAHSCPHLTQHYHVVGLSTSTNATADALETTVGRIVCLFSYTFASAQRSYRCSWSKQVRSTILPLPAFPFNHYCTWNVVRRFGRARVLLLNTEEVLLWVLCFLFVVGIPVIADDPCAPRSLNAHAGLSHPFWLLQQSSKPFLFSLQYDLECRPLDILLLCNRTDPIRSHWCVGQRLMFRPLQC